MGRFFKPYSRDMAKVYIDPGLYFLTPILLLTLPLHVLISWLAAATIHELGHIAAIIFFGGKIRKVCIGIGGAVIEGEDLGITKNILSIIAGPLLGIVPVFFVRRFPETALFACMFTICNLLPFWPLDGGRVLDYLRNSSNKAKKAARMTECIFLLAIIAAAVYLRTPIPLLPLILPMREKYLAKRGKRGYNSATIKVR